MAGKNSGKSKGGNGGQFGKRRRKSSGGEYAPRSMRAKGKETLSDCTPEELEKAGVA